MSDPNYLAQLRERLDHSFDEEELRTLTFELGIGYDNIAGSTKAGKTRELVAALDRQGRIPELVALCARNRPHIDWPEPPQPQQTPPAISTADSYAPVPQEGEPFGGPQGDVPIGGPQGDVPIAGLQGDVPVAGLQGDVPVARLQGDVPVARTPQARDTVRSRKLLFAGLAAVALLAFVIVIGVAAVALVSFSRSGEPASLEGMIRIPAGTYRIGRGAGGADHEPEREMALDAYWIDKYEVTNARYTDYVDAEGPPPANWSGGNYPEGEAYCKWSNKRLPSEAEWEAAARGDQGLLYPWGDSANQVTLPEDSPYPVGTFLADHTFHGLFDTAYNVHEWVGEPYVDVQSREKVLRGGSGQLPVDLATRIIGDPNAPTMTPRAGFRCAVDADGEAGSVSPDLLFRDDFTDPDSGWTIGPGDNPGYHTPDWYHLEARASAPIVLLGPEGNSNRGDVSMVTEIFQSLLETINDGDFRYGLVARKSSDQSYYAFMISPNRLSWSVVKQTPAGPIEIASGRDESIVGLDQHNWLRLDASGQTFVFWVNGRLLYQFSDPEAPLTGDIGYIVETLGASRVHVHVEYLEVTKLAPNPIPAPTVDAGT